MQKDVVVIAGSIVTLIAVVALGILLGMRAAAPTVVQQTKMLGLVASAAEDGHGGDWQSLVTLAAAGQNIDVVPIMAQRSQDSQIEAIRSLIVYQVDMILFSPVVENGWDKVLQEACNAGIPVVAVEKAAGAGQQELIPSYVGYDYYAASGQLTQLILEQAPPDAVLVEICGTTGSHTARKISWGIRQTALDRLPVAHSVNGDWMRSYGREVVENMLQSQYKIDIVVAHNDEMALGAIEALEQAGKKPGEDVRVYAFGNSEDLLELTRLGKISGQIEPNTNELQKLIRSVITQNSAAASSEPVALYAGHTLRTKESFA